MASVAFLLQLAAPSGQDSQPCGLSAQAGGPSRLQARWDTDEQPQRSRSSVITAAVVSKPSQHGAAAGEIWLRGVGAFAGLSALVWHGRRRRAIASSRVTMFAAKKKKKGKGAKDSAVAKALAALQKLEGGEDAAKAPASAPTAVAVAEKPAPPPAPKPAPTPEPEPAPVAEQPPAPRAEKKNGRRERRPRYGRDQQNGHTQNASEDEATVEEPVPAIAEEPVAEVQEEPAAPAMVEEPQRIEEVEEPVMHAAAEPIGDAASETSTATEEAPSPVAEAPPADASEIAEPPSTERSDEEDTGSFADDEQVSAVDSEAESTAVAEPPTAVPAAQRSDTANIFASLASDLEKVKPATAMQQSVMYGFRDSPTKSSNDMDSIMSKFVKEKPKKARDLIWKTAEEEEEEADQDLPDDEKAKKKRKRLAPESAVIVNKTEAITGRRRGQVESSKDVELDKGFIDGDITVGLSKIQVRLGGRQIIKDASWVIKNGERVAMTGANGCGKTTQLKVLMGDLEPDEGFVYKSDPDIKMAVLTQTFVDEMDPDRTLKQELLTAVAKQAKVLEDIDSVQVSIENETDDMKKAELIEELTQLQVKAEEMRVFNLDKRIDRIMAKVGFLPEDLDAKVGSFSGGWKVRIGLSKIFMQAPDVLLLDEPTNHLDLESVEWLEGFLVKQELPIAFVSHDREFMNRVCTRVIDTVDGKTYKYGGNYADFMAEKEQRFETWKKKHTAQEKELAELQEFIKLNKQNQNMAQVRQKKQTQIDKILQSSDFMEPPPRPTRRIAFRFPEPPKARRGSMKLTTLASMQDVTHGYGEAADSTLFNRATLTIRPGDKIGIVGRNGTGKSTLLRLLMGWEDPSGGGKVIPPDPRHTQFFSQHQADLLPAEGTPWKIVQQANQMDMTQQDLEELMKKFRFSGERLNQKIENLSGGERARLAILCMMLTPSQVLVFDEPTNHLDVPMKETLEFALREYQGAVVVVSHDRWFLSQTCKRIVAIEKKPSKMWVHVPEGLERGDEMDVDTPDGQTLHITIPKGFKKYGRKFQIDYTSQPQVYDYQGDFRYYMDTNSDARQKIEKHYLQGSMGIDSLPYTQEEEKAKARGGLKKYRRERERAAEDAVKEALFSRASRIR
eukprot:TRINITY_DN984_c0_g1_i2.p1 TRINITY_DN984_c0_g1~~TRINITY_DN984_c0_g1_i2.p1  ORF type:complete len:1125 (+),score=350.42 TRINITY_DN984_c0_g1_i2:73-3447(+)